MVRNGRCYYYKDEIPSHEELVEFIAEKKKRITYQTEEWLDNPFDIDVSIEVSKRQCSEVVGVIEDTIKLFEKQMNSYECEVFLNGSLARGTCRVRSDIDLNFLYEEKHRDEMLVIEELICYCVSEIVGIKRDRIHTMMIYQVDEEYITEDARKYEIVFPSSKSFSYICRENSEELLRCNRESPRSKQSFLSYISKAINSTLCNEWCFSFRKIFCTGNSVFDNLSRIEHQNTLIDIAQACDSYKVSVRSRKKEGAKDCVEMSEFKKKLKTIPFYDTYNVLSLFRKLLVVLGIPGFNINLADMYDDSLSCVNVKGIGEISYKDVIRYYYEYQYYIMRVERVLNSLGNELSTHSREIYYDCQCASEYNKVYNDSVDSVLKLLSEKRSVLYGYIERFLEEIKKVVE